MMIASNVMKKAMPKWILAFIVSSTAFALVPLAIAAKARNSHSKEPHIHIFPDMDFQPRYNSDTTMDLFGDGRSNRGVISGTVARGEFRGDDILYRGLENGVWALGFPQQFEVSEVQAKRGQNRFNIYCAPCHGHDGKGNGAIPQRVAAANRFKKTSAPFLKQRAPLFLPSGCELRLQPG